GQVVGTVQVDLGSQGELRRVDRARAEVGLLTIGHKPFIRIESHRDRDELAAVRGRALVPTGAWLIPTGARILIDALVSVGRWRSTGHRLPESRGVCGRPVGF